MLMDADNNQTDALTPRLERFFRSATVELAQARQEIEQHDRKYASRFNVFNYIDPDENRLSDILGDLLNPHGAHGQNDAFLRLLAVWLGVTIPAQTSSVKVYREEATVHGANLLRRIDILVDFGKFGLGIENKPWAGEQTDQVHDYLVHLDRRYKGNFVLLYLSGSGAQPESVEPNERSFRETQGQFRTLDYRNELTGWLGECVKSCEADQVRCFLQDFRAYAIEHFAESVSSERG